jgi:PTH2 family peptidyl-tRNA hydrolase
VRTDLGMTQGKLASQAGHAYLDAYIRSVNHRPVVAGEYCQDGHGTKVCLGAINETALLHAYEQAQSAGLPCALIIDSGHIMLPHFDGNEVVTALGIGPCRRDEIQSITKKFQLIK